MDWELGKREEVMYWWDEYKKAGTSLWEESLRQINKFGAGFGSSLAGGIWKFRRRKLSHNITEMNWPK